MKNGKKIFILVETFLGLMVFVLVMFMFLEKNEKKQEDPLRNLFGGEAFYDNADVIKLIFIKLF